MIWNEPNNKSHWDFEIDPEWKLFGDLVKVSCEAVAAENTGVLKVLGGISPIDASTNAQPTVGCPANGSSEPGVKMRTRRVLALAAGGNTKTVSE